MRWVAVAAAGFNLGVSCFSPANDLRTDVPGWIFIQQPNQGSSLCL